MENLLRSSDPMLIGTVLLPLALVGAAWALRMACAICAVRVPDFAPAATVVVVSIVANLGLRIAWNSAGLSFGISSQLLLMLLATALIVAISVRTSMFSAMAVTITQIFLCGLMYFGLSEVSQAML